MEIIKTRAAQEAIAYRATVATAGHPASTVCSSPHDVARAVEALLLKLGTFSVRVANPGTPRVPPEWSITGLGETDLYDLLTILRTSPANWPSLEDKILGALGLPLRKEKEEVE